MKVEWEDKRPGGTLYTDAELHGVYWTGHTFALVEDGRGSDVYIVVQAQPGVFRMCNLENGNRVTDNPRNLYEPRWREVQARVVVDGFAD